MHGRQLAFYRCSVLFGFAVGLLFQAGGLFADSFDWRTAGGLNWNTSVKSQFGGTCWDFSSCGTIEAHYMLTRNDIGFQPNISEQQNCWETSPELGGTGGGWGTEVLRYSTTHGIVSEAECPHQTSSEDIGIAPYWPLNTGWESRVWKSSSVSLGFTNDTATMKSALKTNGPMLVGIWAGHDLYYSVDDMIANYRAPDASGYDHQVVLVGYVDDDRIASGGYWIIKNSWGYSNTTLTDYANSGYNIIPYGNIEVHNDVSAITGPVYYTGPMYHSGTGVGTDYTGTAATMTWAGGTNSTWSTSSTTRRNWTTSSGGTFTWVNQELQAIFPNGPSRKTLTIGGTTPKVIAHGLNFTGSGYSISSGSLTITNGGITTSEDVTISSNIYIGAPQTWSVASGKTLTISGPLHTIVSDLTITGNGNTVISSAIDGGGVLNTVGGVKPGSLIHYGAGSLMLTGAANFSGDLYSSSGSITFAPGAGVSSTFSGTLYGSATFVVAAGGTVSLSGDSSSFSGGITVNSGRLDCSVGTLSACTFTVNSGTMSVGDGAKSLGIVNMNGGMMDVGGGTKSIRTLNVNGGTVTGAGPINGVLTYKVQAGTVNAVLGGTTGLTKTGSGSATINSPTYAGTTLVQGGRLTFTGNMPSGNCLITGGTLDFGALSGACRTVRLSGGTLTGTGSLGCSVGPFIVEAGRADIALSGTSTGLTKTGTLTTVLTGANTYAGRTTVTGGTLELGSAAHNAVLSLGGADIQSGKVVFDYSGVSPASTILGLLTTSYHGGQWDTGQFKNTTALTTGLTLGWLDNSTTHAVTVMATYAGDFNLDGVVNDSDRNIMFSHLGRTGNWSAGDANYDGRIDLLDWNLWKSAIGLPALSGALAGGVMAPEAGTLTLLGIGMFGLLAIVWRKRR